MTSPFQGLLATTAITGLNLGVQSMAAPTNGVRIPLIVRWPGVTKPGSINSSVVSTVDHYPTILEMTHQVLRPDNHKDGVSFVPALQGKEF